MASYSYKPDRKIGFDRFMKRSVIVVIAVLIVVIVAFFLKTYDYYVKTPLDVTSYPKELSLIGEFSPVELLGLGPDRSSMVLGNRCQQLTIPITSDQAFSIANGITKDFSRPLTHDIYKTTLDHYGIKPVRFTIDKWENELWYATLRFQRGFDVVDMDVRPSDGVAMSVRYNLTIYIDTKTFDEKAQRVC